MAGRGMALVIEPDDLFRSLVIRVLETLDLQCISADDVSVAVLSSVNWAFLDVTRASVDLPHLLTYPGLRVALMGWDPELQETFRPWFPGVLYLPKALFKDSESLLRLLDSHT